MLRLKARPRLRVVVGVRARARAKVGTCESNSASSCAPYEISSSSPAATGWRVTTVYPLAAMPPAAAPLLPAAASPLPAAPLTAADACHCASALACVGAAWLRKSATGTYHRWPEAMELTESESERRFSRASHGLLTGFSRCM